MGADAHFDWQQAAASAVDWWLEAGVEALVDEAPRNWLAKPLPPPPPAQARRNADLPEPPAAVPLPATLDALLAWRLSDAAPEASWPGRAIGAAGAPAPLMVLIDQPEREDAVAGALLSEGAGRLFDRMLAAIGYSRETINLVPFATKRPPAGRIAPEHLAQLTDIARHHAALAAPKRLLALGNAASRAIIGADVTQARGALHAVNLTAGTTETRIEVVASFHPRFLLERPACKADAWKDLQLLIGGLS